MINLTKTKGFGALAHEYGHALDYLFGGYIEPNALSFSLSLGGSVSTNPKDIYKPGTLRKMMYDLLQAVIWEKPGQYSESYQKLKEKFAGDDYWFRRNEIFARTFEQYVQIKLEEKQIVNFMLTQRKYSAGAYLSSRDIKRVYPYMDRLIRGMAERSK